MAVIPSITKNDSDSIFTLLQIWSNIVNNIAYAFVVVGRRRIKNMVADLFSINVKLPISKA